MKKVLHLLTGGEPGGIETLCREISLTNLFDNGFVFMTFGGKIYEQMANSGVKVYPLFKLGRKVSLKKARELLKIARSYDVLIIHHEDPFLGMYYCYTLKCLKIHGIRYVHSCYDDNWLRYKNPIKEVINNFIIQKTLDLSDKVVFVSNAGKISCNNQYKVEISKQCIIYNGISEKLLTEGNKRIKSRGLFANDTIELLYIGRLSYIKGVESLIGVLPNILKDFNIHLTIVGDGDDATKLKQMSKDLCINEYVSFEGFQTNIEKFLTVADYFIYPSTCKEVFGISLVEAMSFGIPCIANRVGGIPEIINDGINGFLTKEISSVELENTIKRALNIDIKEYKVISKEARNRAEYFSIRKCQEGILEVLTQIE